MMKDRLIANYDAWNETPNALGFFRAMMEEVEGAVWNGRPPYL